MIETVLATFWESIVEIPEFLEFNYEGPIQSFVDWFAETFEFIFERVEDFIRRVTYNLELALFAIPWFVYVLAVFLAGWRLKNWKTGLALALMMTFIATSQLWHLTLSTFVIVIFSAIICFILGLPLGILMSKFRPAEAVLRPILDLMQTLPTFVYLIPALMLLGLGSPAAALATTIFAMPPLIRLTYLGITTVSEEVREAGIAFGSTPLQLLFKVEIPQALKTIAQGINQTTMLAISMIVIATLVGFGGLGAEIYSALGAGRRGVGQGFVAGFAVVFLAIILDRIIQGVAERFDHSEGGES